MAIRCTLIATLLFSLNLPRAVFAEAIAPDDPAWRFSNDQVSVAQIAGRRAIRIESGIAFLDEIRLENGTVEFDVYVSGERAFVYLLFRGQSENEYEDLYLRPHKSDLPDALQYSPVFQRRSAWQLYHGERGTAATPIPHEEWVPVRLELTGPRAEVWVGGSDEPAMVVNELGRDPAPGWIAFRGFVPANSSAKYSAYFSNLRVTLDDSEFDVPDMDPEFAPGQIVDWRVSPAFDAPPGPIHDLPEGMSESGWSVPPTQADGSMEFLRWRKIPDGSRHWVVAADTTLRSPRAQTCALHLGFSDEITLFVNGQPILYQDASYRFDGPRQQGVMHGDQVVAYLPLRTGDNAVRAFIGDRFGGWGLSARLVDCAID